jgi:hypothetical protein
MKTHCQYVCKCHNASSLYNYYMLIKILQGAYVYVIKMCAYSAWKIISCNRRVTFTINHTESSNEIFH